jgi:hypothetical protein
LLQVHVALGGQGAEGLGLVRRGGCLGGGAQGPFHGVELFLGRGEVGVDLRQRAERADL